MKELLKSVILSLVFSCFFISCADEKIVSQCESPIQSRQFVTNSVVDGEYQFSACAQKKAEAVCSTIFTGEQIRKFSTTDVTQMVSLPIAGRSYVINPEQTAQQYYVRINIGSEGVLALADTGSSNVIIDPQDFTPDPAKYINQSFYVSYASGTGLVQKYEDVISLNCTDEGRATTIGVLEPSQNLAISILGLAYPSLAVPGLPQAPVTPFFDQIVEQNTTSLVDLFAMALCGHKNGDTIVLGGPHPSIEQASLTYVPVVQEKYYSIDARSMIVRDWDKVGNSWVQKPGAQTLLGDFPALLPDGNGIPTIVDSGSTFNYFPTIIYNNVIDVLKAAVAANNLAIPDAFWTATLGDDDYSRAIDHTTISQLPKFQIIVRGMFGEFVHLDLLPDSYLKQLDKEVDQRTASFRKATSFLNILGQPFMEGYYVEFDRISQPNRIGFASNAAICLGL